MIEEELPELPKVPALGFRQVWAAAANAVATQARRGGAPALSPDSDSETIAAWLQWNDPNGCHTAELADREGFDPYDLGTAWDVLATALSDAGVLPGADGRLPREGLPA